MNQESLVLDFEELLSPADKLVAIVGENGIGKTTVIENVHPYRICPSRAGGYTPGSFSYYEQVYGPEASKELIWSHAGQTYRSSLVFRQTAKTKKTEAYVAVRDGDGWAPYTAPDGTRSDGKTDTYDRCIEAIMGGPELYFTSAFSAQGRKLLASYGNGEIKPLMSELLGLNRVLELGERAREIVRRIAGESAALGPELRRTETAQAEFEAAREALHGAHERQEEAMAVRQRRRDDARRASGTFATVQAQRNAAAETETRRAALNVELARVRDRLASDLVRLREDLAQEHQAAADARDRQARESAWIASRRQTLQVGMDRHRTLIGRTEEITQAANDFPRLRKYQAELEQALAAATAELECWQQLRAEAAQLDGRMTATRQAGKSARETVESLRRRSGLIEQVPCAGTDMQPRCKLLAEAMEARDSLAEAEGTLERERANYKTMQAERQALAAQMEAVADAPERARDIQRTLADHRHALGQAQETAALADALSAAHTSLEAAQTELAELTAREAEQQNAAQAAQVMSMERITRLTGQEQDAQAEATAQQARLERELLALPPADSTQALAAAEQALAAADAALAAADADVERANQQIAKREAECEAADRIIRETEATKRRAAMLEQEQAHWATLAKALSQDGVVALCIDDAGPTLAALANDLLSECFGARFSVRIDTQRATAKGDLREGFEIIVFDSESADEKPLRMTSGGERIWINEAITRAIALYQAQNSGHHYECLFADESDGALDPTKKGQFMRMKRRVLELGDYQREFFISHTPELWGMADATINLEEYKQ